MKTVAHNIQKSIRYTFVFFLLPLFQAFANEDDSFEDDTVDVVPAAPINDFVIPLLVVAIGVGLFFLQKQIKANNNLKNNLNQ